jgi:glycosyltransferase involved in cell wall biosynthesis
MPQYIFLASLSLGGAEKIVIEHLALNYFSKTTLIVLHDKEKEYFVPKGVNLIRLHGKISSASALFEQISFEKNFLIAHLISDKALEYLFSFNLYISLVFHNDKEGWKNSSYSFNHSNISLLITVSNHIKEQLLPLTDKPIVVIKHRVSLSKKPLRDIRQALKIDKETKVIGMVGRIAPQKDYLYALELLKNRSEVLIIVGGFEKVNEKYYRKLIQKIVAFKMQKRVFLVGFRHNVSDYISVFDMGLNTSTYEGLSIATQEMLSYNIPVYVADNLGQKEILDINNNLYFFSKKDNCLELSFKSNSKFNQALNEKIFKYSLAQWNLLSVVENHQQRDEVLFLTQNLGLGGAQRSLTHLLLRLKAPLVVLNRSNHTSFISELYQENIEVKYLDKRDVFDICISLFKEVSRYKKVVFWNLDPKVKLLLTKFFPHKYFVDVSPGNYMLEELKEEILFSQAIDYGVEEYFHSLFKLVSKYDFFSESFLYKDMIVRKTEVIPNGVPIPRKTKENYDFQGNVLILGRVASSKYIAEIVQAFNVFPELLVSVVGSIHKKEEIYFEEKVKPHLGQNIKFYPPIEKSQELMIDYDFIVVLGIHQGSPNTVLEALSVGLPIITNDSGGTKSMLGYSGILLKNISIEEIIKGIDIMSENYSEYAEKSKKRQKEVLEEFSMERFVKTYQQLFR